MAAKATTAVFIDKWHPQKDGTCAISIRVTFQRKKRYYPTIHRLTKVKFNEIMAAKRLREKDKTLRLKLQSLEKKAADIIDALPFFTWESFEKQFLKNRGYTNQVSTAFDNHIASLEANRIGTINLYKAAKKSLDEFRPNVSFAEITPAFLQKYENWMLQPKTVITSTGKVIQTKGNSYTTIGFYLRNLRSVFNSAIAEGLLSKELYPFGKAKDKKYEIPSGANIKKALDLPELALLFHYQAQPGSTAARMKDYWLFMYMSGGLNVKDMCQLKYSNIHDDVLVFERAKTIRTKRNVESIRVPLLAETRAIIERWGNKPVHEDAYIFPVLHQDLTPERAHQIIQQITGVINDNMRKITAELGIKKAATTYVARHSYASVLKRSGASTEFISEAMGHSNLRTTQNYLASFEDDHKKKVHQALINFKK